MTDPLHVAPDERETIRVYALDLSAPEAEAIASAPPANGAPSPLESALGFGPLDPAHVEIFPASDLKGVGLSGYLTEGLGIAAADVAPLASRLDAETGYIVILHARAFHGLGADLSPRPPLRPLATFRLAQAAPPAMTPPAAPDSSATTPPRRSAPAAPARMPRLLALLILLLAAGLALWLAFALGNGG